jgi:glycosyltransferase involved in cell wall biosynthesis
MKTVDIVVPCYNYGRFLRGCVESVLSQQGVNVRVLIIDDGSPDDTPQIGRALAAEDARVAYRRHEPNQGFFPTINEGLFDWASADYCLLLSADDALAPGALARATALMDAHPEVGLVYGLGMILKGEAEPHGAPQAPGDYKTDILPGARFLEFCCEVGNPVPTPTAVLRTALQHKIGRYNPDLPHTSDYEMWMRCALHGDVGFVHAVQGYYRVHGAAMSAQYLALPIRDMVQCHRAVTTLLANAGDRVQSPQRLLKKSRQSRTGSALYHAHARFDAGDIEGVKALVASAAEAGFDVFGTSSGLRLKAGLLAGPRVYRTLMAGADILRGRKRRSPPGPPTADPDRDEQATIFGGWPQSARDRETAP